MITIKKKGESSEYARGRLAFEEAFFYAKERLQNAQLAWELTICREEQHSEYKRGSVEAKEASKPKAEKIFL